MLSLEKTTSKLAGAAYDRIFHIDCGHEPGAVMANQCDVYAACAATNVEQRKAAKACVADQSHHFVRSAGREESFAPDGL
jgi:hypothetical protein